MKTPAIILTIAFLSHLVPAVAQAPPDYSDLCREQMRKLAYFAGEWEGAATMRTGPGPEQTIKQSEYVQYKLDSTVLVIEGTGRDDNNQVVFNALAVVNFNAPTRDYALRSYLKDGRTTAAYFNVVEENKFEWGFDIPGNTGKVRYTIILDPDAKTWHEVGEFSADGAAWMKFIDMRLRKKG